MDETRDAWGTQRKSKNTYTILVRKPKGRHYLGDGKKWKASLTNRVWEYEVNSTGS
jgi:hypothetical protein